MVIHSDPNVLHLMLTKERPVLWTWKRLIEKTEVVWARR